MAISKKEMDKLAVIGWAVMAIAVVVGVWSLVNLVSQKNGFTNSLGMKFVPVHGAKVMFSVWETRVEDFEAFVRATGYDATARCWILESWKQRGKSWKNPGFMQSENHPVCGVSWENAQAFCRWLTDKERREGKIKQSQEYRLPTDAEWSVAVGLSDEGSGTPVEKHGKNKGVYPWGTQWPPPRGAGNYSQSLNVDSYEKTASVGSFVPNRYGLYDMGGNVWEWCEDDNFGRSSLRILRGASWFDADPGITQSSCRSNIWLLPGDSGYGGIGFRCVLAGGL